LPSTEGDPADTAMRVPRLIRDQTNVASSRGRISATIAGTNTPISTVRIRSRGPGSLPLADCKIAPRGKNPQCKNQQQERISQIQQPDSPKFEVQQAPVRERKDERSDHKAYEEEPAQQTRGSPF
jgi:hypothetical protein